METRSFARYARHTTSSRHSVSGSRHECKATRPIPQKIFSYLRLPLDSSLSLGEMALSGSRPAIAVVEFNESEGDRCLDDPRTSAKSIGWEVGSTGEQPKMMLSRDAGR